MQAALCRYFCILDKGGVLTERNFTGLIKDRWSHQKFVCVGLDPDLAHIPDIPAKNDADRVYRYMCGIVDGTWEFANVLKPQEAGYAQLGADADETLRRVIIHIKAVAPGVPVILDAKRGDIGNTNEWYAKHLFDYLGVDAVTVHPYLGFGKAADVFLKHADKGIIVLCRTSNEGAREFQDLPVQLSNGQAACWRQHNGYFPGNHQPLFRVVAHNVGHHWNDNGNACVVAGATFADDIGDIRKLIGDEVPILIPGIGKQGGDLEKAVRGGINKAGEGIMVSNSSGIDYAYETDEDCGPEDYVLAAHRAAAKMHSDTLAAVNSAA